MNSNRINMYAAALGFALAVVFGFQNCGKIGSAKAVSANQVSSFLDGAEYVNQSTGANYDPQNFRAENPPLVQGEVNNLVWEMPGAGRPDSLAIIIRGYSNNWNGLNVNQTWFTLPSDIRPGTYTAELSYCYGISDEWFGELCENYGAASLTFEIQSAPVVAPTSPQNLLASVSGQSVTLNWSRPSSGRPASYELEVLNSSNGQTVVFESLDGSVRTYSIPSLSAGTYVAKLKACSSTCSSEATTSFQIQAPPADFTFSLRMSYTRATTCGSASAAATSDSPVSVRYAASQGVSFRVQVQGEGEFECRYADPNHASGDGGCLVNYGYDFGAGTFQEAWFFEVTVTRDGVSKTRRIDFTPVGDSCGI